MRGFNGRFAPVLALSLLLLWTATGLQARQPAFALPAECEVTVGVEQIPIQAEPVTVTVAHTTEIAEPVTATFPEESGVTVASVDREETDEPQTLRLVLNTSDAVAGEWSVTVAGGETQCRGSVRVGSADSEDR